MKAPLMLKGKESVVGVGPIARIPFGVALMQVTQPTGSDKGTRYNTIESTFGGDKESHKDED